MDKGLVLKPATLTAARTFGISMNMPSYSFGWPMCEVQATIDYFTVTLFLTSICPVPRSCRAIISNTLHYKMFIAFVFEQKSTADIFLGKKCSGLFLLWGSDLCMSPSSLC